MGFRKRPFASFRFGSNAGAVLPKTRAHAQIFRPMSNLGVADRRSGEIEFSPGVLCDDHHHYRL